MLLDFQKMITGGHRRFYLQLEDREGDGFADVGLLTSEVFFKIKSNVFLDVFIL